MLATEAKGTDVARGPLPVGVARDVAQSATTCYGLAHEQAA
jgi:hypothetical protein